MRKLIDEALKRPEFGSSTGTSHPMPGDYDEIPVTPMPDDDSHFGLPSITFVGCGNAGCIVAGMVHDLGTLGVDTIAINLEKTTLCLTTANKRLLIGKAYTKGFGAGGDLEIARRAAEEAGEKIANMLGKPDLCIVFAGMGGGTGTGVAPVVARIAKEKGAVVIGLISAPFNIEGPRPAKAEKGIIELQKAVDTLIRIDCDRLDGLDALVPGLGLHEKFRVLDRLVTEAAFQIIAFSCLPALVCVCFADVRDFALNGRTGTIMISEGKTDDPEGLVSRCKANMLHETDLRKINNCLLYIIGDETIRLRDADAIIELISRELDPDTRIIFNVGIRREMKGHIRLIAMLNC